MLQQEGWHYELEKKEDPLTYKGVVYNEMKGVYSSPDQIMGRITQNVRAFSLPSPPAATHLRPPGGLTCLCMDDDDASIPGVLLAGCGGQSLFPDNTYSVDSGGDPLDIPNLTFDQVRGGQHHHRHSKLVSPPPDPAA